MSPSSPTSGQKQSPRIPFTPRLQLDYAGFSKLRELIGDESVTPNAQSRFACHLAMYLPDVARQIRQSDFGITHLEVGVLSRATCEAICRNEWDTVRKHFAFVTDLLGNCGAELNDALKTIYIENLFLDGTASIKLAQPHNISQRMMHTLSGMENLFGTN